jgi:hypothetical protein
MAFQKNDKVLVITGDDSIGYQVDMDEVSSVSGGQVSLSKKPDKFKPTGKHKTKGDSAIVPMPEYLKPANSQSAFARSGTVTKILLPEEKVKELLEGVV